MKLTIIMGVISALMLHAGFILFGGLLFPEAEKTESTTQEVELLAEDAPPVEEKKPEEPATEKAEEIEAEAEVPPDATEMIRNLELSEAARAPELEALSLSAIEAALNGQGGGGGEFAQSLDLTSGGIIGGKGKAGALDGTMDEAFSLSEIDQKPRAIFQDSAAYPAELRGKKIEGVVTVLFVVDAAGKVINPRVDKSTLPSFDRPALEAVKKWKFEPAIRSGKRVACKMSVPIRFQPR